VFSCHIWILVKHIFTCLAYQQASNRRSAVKYLNTLEWNRPMNLCKNWSLGMSSRYLTGCQIVFDVCQQVQVNCTK